MAGYKCVNFGDLCRLCASSNGGRIGIFSDEGKRKNIHVKITDCLKIKVYEKDRLPKSVCAKCLKQLEAHVEFRESVVKAQGMLESCLNSTKLRNGGMVYIKDDSVKDDQSSTQTTSSTSSPVAATITLPTIQTQPPPQATPQVKLLPTIPASSSALQQQTATITTAPAMTPIIINSLPKGFAQAASTGNTGAIQTATIMAPNADFLNSIMQAVGIQTGETSVAAAAVAAAASTQESHQHQQNQQQQPLAQYTITVDGQTIKANQIHYKLQDGTSQAVLTAAASGGDGEQQQHQQGTSSYQQMDEFLRMKTPVKVINRKELEKTPEPVSAKKPKISVLIKSPTTPQATLVTSTPPKQTILAATTPMATVSSSPITLTPVSSHTSIASFSSAPTGTIFTSSPLIASSAGSTAVKSTTAIPVLDAKMMQGNKCVVPIMLKSEGGGEQIALAPIANVGEMNKTMVPNVQYVQMKLQPGPDGMFRLAPAQMPPALTLTPQGLQQFGISPMETIQIQPPQQHQQIQIQPQQIQAQLSMPSVQVPLSNYLSLVEKSSQVQNQSATEVQPQQANIVITTQPVQQQPQQQTPVQQTQHLQVVQRPSIQVQQPAQQPPPKPPKPNPPQPPPAPPPSTTTRRDSSSQDQLNSSSESMSNVTNASIAATQQMKAISALSLLKQDTHPDSLSGTNTQGTNANVSSTVSFTSCDVCSKSFKRKEHLMQHLKSHVGLRPFKCDEAGCSKSFSRKEHLMRHIVSHTGKKLFACPICRKYFSRKDNLKKHKKTHQENSSSAPYHCTICSKHFYIKGHFLKHKQMHDIASEAQKPEKRSPPVKVKTEAPAQTQQLPTVQQSQQQQQPMQQQQQHQIQQVQLPTQQQPQQQAQPQPQMPPVSLQSQQIFTIPAAQLQNALSGKGPIIQQLQIAMPTSMATATSHSTLQTVSASALAGLGVGGATVTGGANSGGTKTAIIKSADGSSATVYTLPSNFIIDGTQFLGAIQQQQQQSRELMGSIGNIKIEQIT